MTIEDEIRDVSNGRPHLVILGAGASVAAAPRGDKHGKILPVMDNLVQTLGLEDLLRESPSGCQRVNFEDLYSDLWERGDQKLTREIEHRVFDYFSSLALPDSPTIYDHLVLSLRPKDAIATFNWDPFLWQACARNHSFHKLPHLLFLHGNTGFGWCEGCRVMGRLEGKCQKCGKPYRRTPLLFPIRQKDYISNDFIKTAWDLLQMCLEHAYVLTIFGYGAPKTDVEAVNLMRKAWGPSAKRKLEQIEIIDIKNDEELAATWAGFIHTHHYSVTNDFCQSWIANHPRRTCEAVWNQTMGIQYLDNNPAPRDKGFREIWEWYSRFLEYELVKEAKSDESR